MSKAEGDESDSRPRSDRATMETFLADSNSTLDPFAQAGLLEQMGSPFTNRVVDRLYRFAAVRDDLLIALATQALSEDWGQDNYVLGKYLAVHIAWSVEQGRYTHSDNQLYIAAGHLQTRYGTPLYLVLEPNRNPARQPWYLVTLGSQISAPALPSPPEIPRPPEIRAGAEIVMMHDHILGENTRAAFLHAAPPVAQMCAVAGAIQWSINRGLQLPYWYYGKMNYLVPLYLTSREDITLEPDLIAPLQVNPDNLLVRTVLEPTMPYANARVAVERHDRLPPWLLASWTRQAATISQAQIEDPEAASGPGSG